MNNIDPNKNCHEYCRYAKCCRYLKGANGVDPEECAMYYKIEDLIEEARDVERERRAEMAKEMGVDESEVDDYL